MFIRPSFHGQFCAKTAPITLYVCALGIPDQQPCDSITMHVPRTSLPLPLKLLWTLWFSVVIISTP